MAEEIKPPTTGDPARCAAPAGSVIYLQLPSDDEIRERLHRAGVAICCDQWQALRFAKEGVMIVRCDKVKDQFRDIVLDAESLETAIEYNWEMRGSSLNDKVSRPAAE